MCVRNGCLPSFQDVGQDVEVMRTTGVHVNTDAEIDTYAAEGKHEPQTRRTQTPVTRKPYTS